MKNPIVVLFSLLLCVACKEKKSDKNLEITGNIKGLKQGTLYLQKIVDTTFVVIDSIQIDGDSHFQYHVDIQSPEMLYLFLNRGISNSMDNSLNFFAEPGKITIDTELEFFYSKAKITGSKNHELYETYKKIISKFTADELSLTEAKFEAFKNKKQNAIDSIGNLQNNILKRKYLYAVNFVINNKNHEVAPYIVLSDINDINFKYLDTMQKAMSAKVAKSMYGKKFTTFYNERKKAEQTSL